MLNIYIYAIWLLCYICMSRNLQIHIVTHGVAHFLK